MNNFVAIDFETANGNLYTVLPPAAIIYKLNGHQ